MKELLGQLKDNNTLLNTILNVLQWYDDDPSKAETLTNTESVTSKEFP